MKAGEAATVSILRMASAAIKNAEIDKQTELTDEEVQEVLRRQVKQLADALKDFERGGRQDLIEKTKAEIHLLSSYVPAQLSDEEMETRVAAIVASLGPKEQQNMGRAMGAVMKEMKGLADGNRVRDIVSQILTAKT